MTRHSITLDTPSRIAKARAYFERACQIGWRVTFAEPKRTDAQNDRLWEMLGRISKRMDINGQQFDPESWKCIFLKAMGKEVQILPTLDGKGIFPTGFRSSQLGVGEMSDLQTFMETWCAEKGVDIWAENA